MRARALSIWLPLAAAAFSLGSTASAVTIDWVTVGGPGNACDVQPQGCFGAVADVYQIGKYEVTNAQYAEFLNAVADADPNGLWDPFMGADCCIVRSGSPGSYTYAVKPGTGNKPVSAVNLYDTLRFTNWLDNGQPVGAQGPLTTEDGAYTITPAGIAANSITRNPGATVFLPNENEWYKAAYYDALSTSFFDYPTGTNTPIVAAAPSATPNRANFNYGNHSVACCVAGSYWSNVGAYTASVSPNGTYDQGGNVGEWTETIVGANRVGRGGAWRSPFPGNLSASQRDLTAPAGIYDTAGFRVAMIPEPGTALLVVAGLMGLAGRREQRARRPAATRQRPRYAR